MRLVWLPRAQELRYAQLDYIAVEEPQAVVQRTPFVPVYRVRPKAQRVEIWRALHGAQQWPP